MAGEGMSAHGPGNRTQLAKVQNGEKALHIDGAECGVCGVRWGEGSQGHARAADEGCARHAQEAGPRAAAQQSPRMSCRWGEGATRVGTRLWLGEPP